MKFFRIFSFEPISKSASAQFLYCPTCQTERTIEFRNERTYFAFLRMPIWPVTDESIVPRCLSCRNEFYPNDLKKAAVQHESEVQRRIIEIVGGFLRFYEFTDDASLNLISTELVAENADLFQQSLREFVMQSEQGEWLLFVSRRSDPLPVEKRTAILEATSKLRRDGENAADVQFRIQQFANAIGFGQDDVQSLIERLC